MKLGLLTDIHEHVEHLQAALDRFQAVTVDQVVVIGDVFQMGHRLIETCRLLEEANAIGVWGNHDFGLCFEPTARIQEKFPASVLSFMGSLRPTLEVDGCHFSHVEPWLDPTHVADLWYFEGPPDEHRKLDRIFDAVPNRIMFGGHYHKWMIVRPDGISSWTGEEPILLDDGRYFVVIGALCEGQFATFDTQTSELVPYRIE